jgi:RNA polymerase sigma-70 factor (ECF subfamily)
MLPKDQLLIKECREGTPEAYEGLVETYQEMVYNIAYRMLGDRESAKDISQDSFLAAYENLHNFRSDSKFSTWLCSITLNKCRDHLRTRKTHVAIEEIAELPASGMLNPEEELSRSQLEKGLQSVLNTLPVEAREVIVLKHMNGLEYSEMEAIVGVNANALKVRTFRARELLKKRLIERGILDG